MRTKPLQKDRQIQGQEDTQEHILTWTNTTTERY